MRRSILIMGGIAAAVVFGGVAAGCGSPAQTASAVTVSAAPVTTTVKQTVTVITTAPAPAPVTVTVTAPPLAPVTATATVTAAPAAPAASADPAGAKANGKFLVGSQVSSGTWQCDKAGDLPYWSVNAQDNSIIDNGLDTIAIVSDSGYTLTLQGCSTLWNKVG